MLHLVSFGCVLPALLLASTLHAQNHREMPIGGRTATMGGAATAAGNDSAMPYLNPAGLAGVPGDIFAVSATVYSYTHRSFQNLFFPSGTQPGFGFELEEERFATSSVGELPSSVMYFNHLSKPKASTHHHVGVSMVVPGARRVELVASVSGRLENFSGTSTDTMSLVTDSKRYYLGPTYAVGIGPSFRFGVSAYVAYYRGVSALSRTTKRSLLGGSTTFTSSGENSQVSESFSFVPVIGAQLEVLPRFWAGLGFSPPSLPVTGRTRFNASTTGTRVDVTSGVPQARSSTTTADMDFYAHDPLRLNVGVAYEARETFSVAADVHYYLGGIATQRRGVVSVEDQLSGDVTRRFHRKDDLDRESDSVIDFSVGAEVSVARSMALRGGFFSDLSAGQPIRNDENQTDTMRLLLDRYGGTLGLGFTVGSFDTTAGIVVARGEGEFAAYDVVAEEIVGVPSTETTGMLVLSGAVTVEEAKKKIRETLPFEVPVLPDLGTGAAPPAPRIPRALPPEPKPAPPPLKTRPSPAPDAPPAGDPPAAPASPPAPPAAPAPGPIREAL